MFDLTTNFPHYCDGTLSIGNKEVNVKLFLNETTNIDFTEF